MRCPCEEEVRDSGEAENVRVVVCQGEADWVGGGMSESKTQESEGWEGGAGAQLHDKRHSQPPSS